MAALYGTIEEASAAPVFSIKMPARGVPNKYPGAQKEAIKVIDDAAEPGVSIVTAVGNVTKKLPFAQPLTIANTKSGGSDELTGHIAIILTLLMSAVMAVMSCLRWSRNLRRRSWGGKSPT